MTTQFPENWVNYAPWLNVVSVGGAIWKPPRLLSYKREDGTEFHILRMFLASFRHRRDKRRKLFLPVDIIRGAEYWHSKLRVGAPIHCAGELRTEKFKRNDGTTAIQQKLLCHTVTLLYPPSGRYPYHMVNPEALGPHEDGKIIDLPEQV